MRQRSAVLKNTSANSGKSLLSIYLLIALCGTLIAVGFFFVGLQHFSAVQLEMKNNEVRQQVENLQAENRRLLLVKEIALSPSEIKKSAKYLGFVKNNAEQRPVVAKIVDKESKTPTMDIVSNKLKPTGNNVVLTSFSAAKNISKENETVKKIIVKSATEGSTKGNKTADVKSKKASPDSGKKIEKNTVSKMR